jgi:N-acetylmuramoyl-L-alanine amidase
MSGAPRRRRESGDGVSVTPILRAGDGGDAVRDLQHRLVGAGETIAPAEFGAFGAGTEAAVRAFQTSRQIRVDGIVGPETWSVLVESGFTLGDRLLYLQAPNLRGDDVNMLQHTLNRLGFDAGREDGILGPDTASALREFQRNAGLTVDGISGPATLEAFRRVERMAGGSVAAVRERDELRRPVGLAGRRVYLAVALGFDQIGTPIRQGLERCRAQVMHDVSGADDHALAARANRWGADLFLAVRAGDTSAWEVASFESGAFRSERGCHTALALAEALGQVGVGVRIETVGRAYTVLRETRMAAVVCAFGGGDAGDLAHALTHSAELGAAITAGTRRAFDEPRIADIANG